MSRAGAMASREPEDFYTTPSWVVRRLLEEWSPRRGGTWVEPAAGNGAIIRAVEAYRPNLVGTWRAWEVREEERAALQLIRCEYQIANFLQLDSGWTDETVDVVLTNPPYRWAFEFVMQARKLYPRAEIVFLLRTAFKASQERYRFMRGHFPDSFELPDRPSFTGEGGGDSADYAWLRWPADWERTSGVGCLLAQTPLEERQRDRGHVVRPVDPQVRMF